MVSVYLILHCGENAGVTLRRLVSDIRRGAPRATRPGHDVTSMGLPVHLDSPGPDSEVLALMSRAGGRPLDSKLELPSVLAARPSAMRVPSQTAGTSLLKPDSTPLQNKIKLSASLRAGSSIIKNLCY